MSLLIVTPDVLSSAARDLAAVQASLSAANGTAFADTTPMLAAGTDEVSTAIAALFSAHGQEYQALSSQVETFHEGFLRALAAGAASYAGAAAAASAPA